MTKKKSKLYQYSFYKIEKRGGKLSIFEVQ